MKIGYKVEGKNDVAFLEGLKARWCQKAELMDPKTEVPTRGKPWMRKTDIPKVCSWFSEKGYDIWIFLNDADTDKENEYRAKLKDFHDAVPAEYKHRVIIGLCFRNVECWLCADADWIAKLTGRQPNEFRVPDPQGVLNGSLGEDARVRIVAMVKEAPLNNWVKNNKSFEKFYQDIWDLSKNRGCEIENLS